MNNLGKGLNIELSAWSHNYNLYIQYIYIYEELINKIINHVFSLCIPINVNQTAVGLFWLG